MTVDPHFYVVQAVYFLLAAILFGIFVDFLRKEVQLNGWSLTPRLVRHICLCCSSLGLVVVHLDTFGALGIYSDPWQLFVSHLDASMLVGSVCASLYMYVLISFKGESIPLAVVRLWVATNVGGFILVFIDALICALTNNIFWSFVCTCILMTQEVFLYLGFLIIVYRTTRVLKSMGQTTDYSTQICKLWKVMAFAACVFTLAFSQQSSQLKIKMKWGVPAPVTNHEVFEPRMVVPDLVLLGGHLVLLYMLRPPTKPMATRVRLTASSGESKGSRSSPLSGTSTLASSSSKEMNSGSSQIELCIIPNN